MRRKPIWVVAFTLIALTLCASISRAGTTRHQLDAPLPEVRFDGVGLADALDFLRDVSSANINVNWKAIEESGVTKDTPVNVRLRSISLRKALSLILTQAGGGTSNVGFTLDQGVIEITTQEKIDSITYTRVYPVEDLIMEIPEFNDAPNFDLNATSSSGSSGAGGGGGGGAGGGNKSLFGSSSGAGTGDDKGKTKAERAQDLINLIKELIQPDIWDTGKAAIRFFNGNLVVSAPRSVQEAIGGPFD